MTNKESFKDMERDLDKGIRFTGKAATRIMWRLLPFYLLGILIAGGFVAGICWFIYFLVHSV